MRLTFMAALAANIINAAVITYSESKAAFRVHKKMTESHLYLA
jgi:hypothetical protein